MTYEEARWMWSCAKLGHLWAWWPSRQWRKHQRCAVCGKDRTTSHGLIIVDGRRHE